MSGEQVVAYLLQLSDRERELEVMFDGYERYPVDVYEIKVDDSVSAIVIS